MAEKKLNKSEEKKLLQNQDLLKKLELDTDELYRMKIESRALFDRISYYLPEVEKEIITSSGEKRIIKRSPNWQDVINWKNKGELEKIFEKNISKELSEEENREIKIQRRVKARLNDVERGLFLLEKIRQQEENVFLKKYKWFRLRELVKAKKVLSIIEEKMSLNRIALHDAIENEDIYDIRILEEEYKKLENQYQEIVHSSPEAYLWKAGQNLLEIKKVFDENGTIVETPYVKEKIAHILDEIEKRPVFIHGELSTGKTELAKYIARRYLSKYYLERWEKENPKPKDPELLKKWERAKEEAREPLQIRGMRGLEKEDILSRIVLKKEPMPLPEEQVKFLISAAENFKKNFLEKELENIKDPKEKDEFIKRAIENFEEAYMERWKSGIITIEELSPVFQAMEQGRPLIIDEINAIPHHVLIVLNDIINKKPGDVVFSPNGKQIKVQEGFYIIATGNWKPEDSILYPGRAILDAAFLSRFAIEEYDYLPQNIKRESEKIDPEALRKQRQEDELFMMLITRLLDNQLGVELPEGSIEKIRELARAARVLQDVFSGKITEKSYWARGGKIDPKEVLKENVLAYRQLFPILERWKKEGFVRPLDDYIFLEYVKRSSARPQEMKYIYNLLQTQFDFFSGGDWPKSTGESDKDITEIMNYNIVRKIYGVDSLSHARRPIPDLGIKLRYYSPKEIIEEIFGPVPERKNYNIEILEENVNNEEERIERARQLFNKVKNEINYVFKDDNVSKSIKKELEELKNYF